MSANSAQPIARLQLVRKVVPQPTVEAEVSAAALPPLLEGDLDGDLDAAFEAAFDEAAFDTIKDVPSPFAAAGPAAQGAVIADLTLGADAAAAARAAAAPAALGTSPRRRWLEIVRTGVLPKLD